MSDSVWYEKLGLLEAKVSWLEAELNDLNSICYEKVSLLEAKLNELKDEAKPKEPERWRPSRLFVDELMSLFEPYRHNDALKPIDREAVLYLLIKELARELNDGWLPDWSSWDDKDKKAYTYFDHRKDTWAYSYTYYSGISTIAFADDKIYDAIKILNRGDIDILVEEVCGER